MMPRVRLLHHAWIRHIAILMTMIAAVIMLMGFLESLGAPPDTQQDAEEHLDRPILWYSVWDGVPYEVFEVGDSVHFDHLILDWISIEWPPTPRWQWSGMWSTIDATADPASVRVTDLAAERVIYGQVNSDVIMWLEVEQDGATHRFPVSSPAFAVRLPPSMQSPDSWRWLDAGSHVVWSVEC